MSNNLRDWAKTIAQKSGLALTEEIYHGDYYEKDKIRDVIYAGTYKNKSAVLKVYNDPRFTDEPASLKAFLANNQSKKLIAPVLYDYKIESPGKGWLIMEKLPNNGDFFQPPLKKADRQKFLELFLEYRQNFPLKPARSLTLSENLPASEFVVRKVGRYFGMAEGKEAELVLKGGKAVLEPDEIIPRYLKAVDFFREQFKDRKMVWCHGHFKPQEIYHDRDRNIYYLTDFAHTNMFEEGYELGFIIWADCLMTVGWKENYDEWRAGIYTWIKELKPVAAELKITDYDNLIRASLVERILGTIFADICATDKPREEKITRINHLYRLLDELM